MGKNIESVIQFLKIITLSWGRKISIGKICNVPIGIEISKSEYEALTCLLLNIKGTGASSHGYDHDNGDETKGCSEIQPKDCKHCGKKNHYHTVLCECGSKEFKIHKDCRWGIDCKAHFEYEVPNYHLWFLKPKDHKIDNNVFFLTCYTISSKNRMFNNILKVQYDSPKSKMKNLLPNSGDFYACNPKVLKSFKITLTEDGSSIVEDIEIKPIILEKNMFKSAKGIKKYLPKSFLIHKDIYHYNEIESLLCVNNTKTSHGKKRGTTKRRN